MTTEDSLPQQNGADLKGTVSSGPLLSAYFRGSTILQKKQKTEKGEDGEEDEKGKERETEADKHGGGVGGHFLETNTKAKIKQLSEAQSDVKILAKAFEEAPNLSEKKKER